MDEKAVRGRDIAKPVDSLVLDGESWPMAFDMNAFRVAEDVYELHYGRSLNFAEIVQALAAGKIGAVMAVLYGAICSGALDRGAEPLPWEAYAKKFKLVSIPGMQELLMKRVKDALPEPEVAKNPTEAAAET